MEAFDFIDEHLYEFCMDNCMYSEDTYQSDPEGDDWMFTIAISQISETEEHFDPRIVKSKGYIQQYPDLDEEEWD